MITFQSMYFWSVLGCCFYLAQKLSANLLLVSMAGDSFVHLLFYFKVDKHDDK